ncbi:hypothetical protein ANO14919_076990 [Xylariales sp. No.14919]|nr:hypothetical protein ANO14919_076990 [Xylariales sp. No.14919]
MGPQVVLHGSAAMIPRIAEASISLRDPLPRWHGCDRWYDHIFGKETTNTAKEVAALMGLSFVVLILIHISSIPA